MALVTIKINTRTKKTQHLFWFNSEIAKSDKNVVVIETGESPYNEEFVK